MLESALIQVDGRLHQAQYEETVMTESDLNRLNIRPHQAQDEAASDKAQLQN